VVSGNEKNLDVGSPGYLPRAIPLECLRPVGVAAAQEDEVVSGGEGAFDERGGERPLSYEDRGWHSVAYLFKGRLGSAFGLFSSSGS